MLWKKPKPREFDAFGVWHVEFIATLARVLRPRVYVELGVYRAELFNQVAPFTGVAIGVDADPASAEFIHAAPNVRFACSTTDAFIDQFWTLGTTIDLLFIDADHCRQAVLDDFRGYFPLVSPHGLILLHDTHPGNVRLTDPGYCCDAYRAIEELQATADGYEMVTIPLSPGLTICRKRTTQLSWMESPSATVSAPAPDKVDLKSAGVPAKKSGIVNPRDPKLVSGWTEPLEGTGGLAPSSRAHEPVHRRASDDRRRLLSLDYAVSAIRRHGFVGAVRKGAARIARGSGGGATRGTSPAADDGRPE